MDTEDTTENQAQLQNDVEDGNSGDYMTPEGETELDRELSDRLVKKYREKQLQIVLQDKERYLRNLTKRYEDLRTKYCELQKQNNAKKMEAMVDVSISRDIALLKGKIKEKTNRCEILEKELENFNKSRAEMDPMYVQRFKGEESQNLQNYQKLAGENTHIENYIRTEHFKKSLDKIQALKLLAEQLSFEVDKASKIKSELDTDKIQYEAFIKKLREDYKKLEEENEKLTHQVENE